MELSPRMYHWLVRPPWWTKRYIHDVITRHFLLHDKMVLDFGCGVGSNCRLVDAKKYMGVERCPKRVAFASRMYPEYQFHNIRNVNLPAPDEYFDVILVVAVLHHISSTELMAYIQEFRRTLKPDGKVVMIEPCLSDQHPAINRFMKAMDKGQHIRNEHGYRELFHNQQFETNVIKQFRKLLLYNELFFTATPH